MIVHYGHVGVAFQLHVVSKTMSYELDILG